VADLFIMKHRMTVWILFLLFLAPLEFSSAKAQDNSFFESHIRPALIEHCYECHSKGKKIRGGLVLDSKAGLIKGGDSGPVIMPGKPDESLFMKALHHQGDLKMPPKGKLNSNTINAFKEWIAKGAVDPRDSAKETVNATTIDWGKSKLFWSFQPVKKTPVPSIKGSSNPIDSFVQKQLNLKGLIISTPATPQELIRRLSFTLTGLPPSVEDVDSFLKDRSTISYEKLVDKYLSSIAYAERWGRHWLDVARYAEDQAHTFGVKPNSDAYKYRDWVIQSFDKDMPFNDFVRYQIAADLMAEPKRLENLAALGFFGLGAQYYKNTDAARAIADELDDRIDTLSRGFLGLTVSCARCHDHKFDPIPTQDYYSIAGVFHSSKLSNTPVCTMEELKTFESQKKILLEAELKLNNFIQTERLPFLEKQLKSFETNYLETARFLEKKKKDEKLNYKGFGNDPVALERWVKFYDKYKSNKKFAFFAGPMSQWNDNTTDEQKIISINKAKDALLKVIRNEKDASIKEKQNKNTPEFYEAFFGNAGLMPLGDSWKKELDTTKLEEFKTLEEQHIALKKKTPDALPVVNAIAESTPSDLKVYIRGNPAKQGEVAPRRFLKIIAGEERKPFSKGSGRTELAEEIVSPDNPLTSRVIVNRIWAWHFGKGIVATPSNFGKLGEAPSNPDLLDYLAGNFVGSGWSIKKLHKLIVTSDTFKQSSKDISKNFAIDPENIFLWKFNRQRLDIESWRDSILSISGKLDKTIGGPTFNLNDSNSKRRTVYAKISRHDLDPLLRIFDFPDPNITSERRIETTVPQQQLFIINSSFAIDQSKELAKRLQGFSKVERDNINEAYKLIFSRNASIQEVDLALSFLHNSEDNAEKSSNKMDRWERFAQVLLASNEFIYID